MKVLLSILLAVFILQGCSFRAITVRTIPEPSPGVFVDDCVEDQDCPGALKKLLLTMGRNRDIERRGLIDISYFVSDLTGPGSVIRTGGSSGPVYDGNLLDCLVLHVNRLGAKADKTVVTGALSVAQDKVALPAGHLRVTPGEFLRFERQNGIGEEFRRIRDVEIRVDEAVLYRESIDTTALRRAIEAVKPYLNANCRNLTTGVGYVVVSTWRVEGLTYRPVRSRLSSPRVTEESLTEYFAFPPDTRFVLLEETGTVKMLDKRALFVGEDYLTLEAGGRVPIPLRDALEIYGTLFLK